MRTLLPLLLLSLSLLFAGCAKIEPKRTYGPAGGVLIVSTIDGNLTALDPLTGVRKWKYPGGQTPFGRAGPVLSSPVNIKQDFTFIPNPQDGQLYILGDGRLSKLPFTIPQLVKASPCRSSDGLLYAGSKKDAWMRVNPETGVLSVEAPQPNGGDSYCPLEPETIFVGRTVYRLSMVDTKRPDRQWNATFTDYPTAFLPDQSAYPFQHIHSSMDGRLLTLDAATGNALWREEFGSLIVNVYLLNAEGMYKLRTQAVGAETFDAMLENSIAYPSPSWTYDPANTNDVENMSTKSKELYPTLYVGETTHGLYAMPALVDDKTITIAPKYIGPPLIEGPTPIAVDNSDAPRNMPTKRPMVRVNSKLGSTYRTVDGEYLLLGYHEPPKTIQKDIMTTQMPDIMPQRVLLGYVNEEADGGYNGKRCVGDRCYAEDYYNRIPRGRQITDESSDDWTFEFILSQIWRKYPYVLLSSVLTVLLLVITTVWLCGRHSALRYSDLSRNGEVSHASRSSRGSGRWSFLSNSSAVSTAYEDAEGMFQIGKITYDPKTVLGKGCQGTIVFRGKFDGREAAVKRVQSHMFKLIDRELNHLRESDSHQNVIRYFCTEEDQWFSYIALELCDCSLHDFVQKTEVRGSYNITQLEVLKQANDGVAHLHNIGIVHRDLKPQNILLSSGAGRARVRVVISDFGLAKPIRPDQMSTMMSGMAGTDGWIAPEILDGRKVTKAVDVFSMGCIFYYVLTGGLHPFGQASRQQKILDNQSDLRKLTTDSASSDDNTAYELIDWMLKTEARRRPSSGAVSAHPLFWPKERQLQFFLDVSDRVEKEDEKSDVMRSLESDAYVVISYGGWYKQLPKIFQDDLRSKRTYNGKSIRDLLRALRNKKHHFKELTPDVKEHLMNGKSKDFVPEEYHTYFTSKFPKLLIHVYRAMSVCSEESAFECYYPTEVRVHLKQAREEPSSYVTPTKAATPPRIPGPPPGFEPLGQPVAELNESDVSNWRAPKTNATKKRNNRNRTKSKQKDRFAALPVEGDDDEDDEENRQPDDESEEANQE